MCYRPTADNTVKVVYSQRREVLQDSNYGLKACDQDDLYREFAITSTDLVRACIPRNLSKSSISQKKTKKNNKPD